MDKEITTTQQAVVKQTADIDGFLAKRNEFIQKVSAICVEGKDYHIIQGKKSLAKGGAEKIASIFQWNATFVKDGEAIEMLGGIVGLVAFKCTLLKGTKFVGEGRGAATVAKNGGDPNKTLKMAQKSAFIDAVLRASGLSDFFTQDLEDMPTNAISQPDISNSTAPAAPITNTLTSTPPSEAQKGLIKKLMNQKYLTGADLIDNGFNLDKIDKQTASEVIKFLIAYQPDQDKELQDIAEGIPL